jgi:hypothetical protein
VRAGGGRAQPLQPLQPLQLGGGATLAIICRRGGGGAGRGARGGGSQSHHVAAQLPTPALLPGGVEVEQTGDLAGVLPLGTGDGGPDCDGRETQSV